MSRMINPMTIISFRNYRLLPLTYSPQFIVKTEYMCFIKLTVNCNPQPKKGYSLLYGFFSETGYQVELEGFYVNDKSLEKFRSIDSKLHDLLSPISEEKFERLCQMFRLEPNSRVLDIDCGNGVFQVSLAEAS